MQLCRRHVHRWQQQSFYIFFLFFTRSNQRKINFLSPKTTVRIKYARIKALNYNYTPVYKLQIRDREQQSKKAWRLKRLHNNYPHKPTSVG